MNDLHRQLTEIAAVWQRIADYEAHMIKCHIFGKRHDLVAYHERCRVHAMTRHSELTAAAAAMEH